MFLFGFPLRAERRFVKLVNTMQNSNNPKVTNIVQVSGADPGFRRGGGVRTFRRGGFVQEFQERIQIVAGPWANQQAKKNADSRRGGFRAPKKTPCIRAWVCKNTASTIISMNSDFISKHLGVERTAVWDLNKVKSTRKGLTEGDQSTVEIIKELREVLNGKCNISVLSREEVRDLLDYLCTG